MKTFKIILWVLLILIVLAATGSTFLLRHISRRAIPDYNAEVIIEGLTGKAEVLRDTFGIPHIYAENEEDLYRVTGYVMAQDRFWQMDLLRHVAQGRMSEILGEDMINTDKLFRALRIEDKSRRIIRTTDPEVLECLNAFSEGINQYLEDAGRNLPFEFAVLGYRPEAWQAIHTVNLIGYISWTSSAAWGNEPALYKISQLVGEEKVRELIPDLDIQEPHFPDFMLEGKSIFEEDLLAGTEILREMGLEVFMGSNSWVVSGDKSFNGIPIVANDMHLQLDLAPGIWYQMHQVVPGKLNVSGIVLPGTPFVDVGHNDSIAWGMTYVAVDDIDFYLETINPADTNQYLLDGEWQDMEVREEYIRIRGGDSLLHINRFTQRGPVISTFKGIKEKVISMRWTGNENSDELKAAYLWNRADNIYDFREGLRTWSTISTNSICGDASGNIALFVASRVPLRLGNRAFMAPGDTNLYDWIGFIPFEELPHGINPPDGILASANNRSAGPDYPYHISHWFALPDRYNRILEMLAEKDKFTPEDMMAMQADKTSLRVRKVKSVCWPILLNSDLKGTALAAFDRVHAWDGHMDMDGIQSTLFEVFYQMLKESVFKDELGEDYPAVLSGGGTIVSGVMDRIMEGQTISWCDDISTPEKRESIEDLVLPSWNKAIQWLEENFGKDMETWVWGDLHTVSLKHPMSSVNILNKLFNLERGPYRAGGSSHTVSVYNHSGLKSFAVSHGASQRHVYNLLDPDGSQIIIPTGVSGIPTSDFFCNQTGMYMRHEYISESFSREKVDKNAVYRSTFSRR